MHTCIYIYTHMHLHTHTHADAHTYMYRYTQTLTHAHAVIWMHKQWHAHVLKDYCSSTFAPVWCWCRSSRLTPMTPRHRCSYGDIWVGTTLRACRQLSESKLHANQRCPNYIRDRVWLMGSDLIGMFLNIWVGTTYEHAAVAAAKDKSLACIGAPALLLKLN